MIMSSSLRSVLLILPKILSNPFTSPIIGRAWREFCVMLFRRPPIITRSPFCSLTMVESWFVLRFGGEFRAWAVFSSSGSLVFVIDGLILKITESSLIEGVMSSNIPEKTLGYSVLVFKTFGLYPDPMKKTGSLLLDSLRMILILYGSKECPNRSQCRIGQYRDLQDQSLPSGHESEVQLP